MMLYGCYCASLDGCCFLDFRDHLHYYTLGPLGQFDLLTVIPVTSQWGHQKSTGGVLKLGYTSKSSISIYFYWIFSHKPSIQLLGHPHDAFETTGCRTRALCGHGGAVVKTSLERRGSTWAELGKRLLFTADYPKGKTTTVVVYPMP